MELQLQLLQSLRHMMIDVFNMALATQMYQFVYRFETVDKLSEDGAKTRAPGQIRKLFGPDANMVFKGSTCHSMCYHSRACFIRRKKDEKMSEYGYQPHGAESGILVHIVASRPIHSWFHESVEFLEAWCALCKLRRQLIAAQRWGRTRRCDRNRFPVQDFFAMIHHQVAVDRCLWHRILIRRGKPKTKKKGATTTSAPTTPLVGCYDVFTVIMDFIYGADVAPLPQNFLMNFKT